MAFLNWQVIFHLPYIGNCLRYHDYLLRKVFYIIQIFMSASRFLVFKQIWQADHLNRHPVYFHLTAIPVAIGKIYNFKNSLKSWGS